jgi:prophage regulatory protein
MSTVKKRLVTYKELRDYGIPYCRTHLDRLEDANEFPRRIPLGRCRVVWELAEIEEWVQSRLLFRNQAPEST